MTARFVQLARSFARRVCGAGRRLVQGTAGESVVETMAAVIVCTLALLMLFTAVATAARINVQADEAAAAVRDSAAAAEVQQAGAEQGTISVTFSGSGLEYSAACYTDSSVGTEGYTSYRLVK